MKKRALTTFIAGNEAARAKCGMSGPRIVKRRGRTGYYIRWYQPRYRLCPLTLTASTPHGLKLEPTVAGGLRVLDDPKTNTMFHKQVEQKDVIQEVAGTHVKSVAEFERILQENEGNSIRITVNRGGKSGTVPKHIKAGDTKDEAVEFLSRWHGEHRNKGHMGVVKNITFAQLAEEYLQWSETAGGYSATWMHQLPYIMKRHMERWGHLPLSRITPAMIEQWAVERQKESSVYAVRNDLIVLKTAFKMAERRNYIDRNPTDKVKIRKPPATIPKYLSEPEVAILLEKAREHDQRRLQKDTGDWERAKPFYNADGTFDAARIKFLVLTGFRKSQFIDLRWHQYDSRRKTITIEPDELHSEKGRRPHVVPLPDAAVAIIEGQPRMGKFVFPNLEGERDTEIPKRFVKIAKEFKNETGKHVHLHMLRHTAFTHLLGYSGNIALVKEYAGHADIKTTMIYAHVLESNMRRITKGFDIRPPEPPPADPVLALPGPQEAQPAAKPSKRKAGKG